MISERRVQEKGLHRESFEIQEKGLHKFYFGGGSWGPQFFYAEFSSRVFFASDQSGEAKEPASQCACVCQNYPLANYPSVSPRALKGRRRRISYFPAPPIRLKSSMKSTPLKVNPYASWGPMFWPFLRSPARAPTIRAVRATVAIKNIFDNSRGSRFLLRWGSVLLTGPSVPLTGGSVPLTGLF